MQDQSVNCKPTIVQFLNVYEAGIVSAAARDRVTIRRTDIIFTVGSFAVGCVRHIGTSRARLCGCWVVPEYRGRGIGEALVRHRLEYVARATTARVVDTFAFNGRLFLSLGFSELRRYKIGTTLFEKEVNREGHC